MTRRRRPTRRSPIITALALILALAAGNMALAALPAPEDEGAIDSASDTHGHTHANHGGIEGHLPYEMDEGIELVGRMRINQDQEGRASDVAVHGTHAYIGAFSDPNCQKGGVYVFDIADPSSPKQINFIRTGGQTYVGEGVQVVELDTPHFQGDILVMNNEICFGYREQPSTVGGVTFVDVTDPKRHRYLAEGVGDDEDGDGRAHQSHSAFIWQQEQPDGANAAYSVIIDNEETADLDILDITDPRNPELIAEYDLNLQFPRILDTVKGGAESFSHDMVVEEVDGRFYMLASYWDGGYVVLDVTDPSTPTLVADSDFAEADEELLDALGDRRVPEGNAHQSELTTDGQYIVGADEDFSPYATTATLDTVAFPGAASGSDTPPLEVGVPITGQAVFVGQACATDPAPPALVDGQIAVAERGVCAFTEKVASIEAAGDPSAILIVNNNAPGFCEGTNGMTVAGGTPTFGVSPRSVGFDAFGLDTYDEAACETGAPDALEGLDLGTAGGQLTFESYFDGWGYVRLFAAPHFTGEEQKLAQLDTYAIPEAHDPAYAEGFGDLSVHEVAVSHAEDSSDLLYFAYYSGGFRVAQIVDGQIEERAGYIDMAGSNVWGVQVWTPETGPYAGQELVLASDRDYGVYVFRYTGPGAPAANLGG